MENSTKTNSNTMNNEANHTEKMGVLTLLVLATVPALIGAWSVACFVGLVVS